MRRVSAGFGVAGLAIGLSAAAVPAHAGGFFDMLGEALFGPRQAPPALRMDDQGGLDVTVRPRHGRTVARPEQGREPREPREPRKIVNTSINPVDHPNWYLEDPTLRRGDVIVLHGQVLVFNGGRAPLTRSDFTSLNESRAMSKSLRDRIRAMAGLPPERSAGTAARVGTGDAPTLTALHTQGADEP